MRIIILSLLLLGTSFATQGGVTQRKLQTPTTPPPATSNRHLPPDVANLQKQFTEQHLAPTDSDAKKRVKMNVKAAEALHIIDKGGNIVTKVGDSSLVGLIKSVPLIGSGVDMTLKVGEIANSVIQNIASMTGHKIIFNNMYQSNHEMLFGQYKILLIRLQKISEIITKRALKSSVTFSNFGKANTLNWFDQLSVMLGSRIWKNTLISKGISAADQKEILLNKELRNEYRDILRDFKNVFRELILLQAYDKLDTYYCALSTEKCHKKRDALTFKHEQNLHIADKLHKTQLKISLDAAELGSVVKDLSEENMKIKNSIQDITDLETKAAGTERQEVQNELAKLEEQLRTVEQVLMVSPGGGVDPESRLDTIELTLEEIKQKLGMPSSLDVTSAQARPGFKKSETQRSDKK